MLFWIVGGIAGASEGVQRIISGIATGNPENVRIGIEFFGLGTFFLGKSRQAIDLKGLAERQLNRLYLSHPGE